MTPPPPSARKPSENRAKLVAAARALFARQGYADTGTEQIVREAGITRGALYYQFEDKRDLFRAVCVDVMEGVVGRLWSETMGGSTREEDELVVGSRLLLQYYSEPEIRRILLVDGPAVLGFEEWRRVTEPLGLALLNHALEHQVAAGRLPGEQAPATAQLLLGALSQAGLAIGASADPEATRDRFVAGLGALLSGLGAEPPTN